MHVFLMLNRLLICSRDATHQSHSLPSLELEKQVQDVLISGVIDGSYVWWLLVCKPEYPESFIQYPESFIKAVANCSVEMILNRMAHRKHRLTWDTKRALEGEATWWKKRYGKDEMEKWNLSWIAYLLELGSGKRIPLKGATEQKQKKIERLTVTNPDDWRDPCGGTWTAPYRELLLPNGTGFVVAPEEERKFFVPDLYDGVLGFDLTIRNYSHENV